MHVRLKGGGLFAFAGLYARAPDGQDTCSIVTTAANELITPFHARMPVILDGGCEALWLDPSATHPQAVLPCLVLFPAERMEVYPEPVPKVPGESTSPRYRGPMLGRGVLLDWRADLAA